MADIYFSPIEVNRGNQAILIAGDTVSQSAIYCNKRSVRRDAVEKPRRAVDSITFLSTATNFLAGEGWWDVRGDPLVGWPPLFPLLLAALMQTGPPPWENTSVSRTSFTM